MKILSVIILSVLITPLAQSAESVVTQTPVDINSRLQDALNRLSEESRKEQELTGGTMAVIGAALTGTALFGTLIGNDYSTQNVPALAITVGGLLTIGGIMNLTRENPLTDSLKDYNDRPHVTLDDVQHQILAGQILIREEAERAHCQRIWGGFATILAGASNVAIGLVSSPPSRQAFEVAGYTTVTLGLADYMIERRRWTGTSLVAMGLSNTLTDRIDPNSPSSDLLLISGAITAAAGLTRLLIKYPAEQEQSSFFDSIKNDTKTEFFVIPTSAGWLVATRVTF